jgi:hypothetical protein
MALTVRTLQKISQIETKEEGKCFEHFLADFVTRLIGLESCHYARKRGALRRK